MNRTISKVAALVAALMARLFAPVYAPRRAMFPRSATSRTTSSVLVALLVTIGLTFSASPAQADDWHCPDGYSCFWTGQHFDGNKKILGAEWYGYGSGWDTAKHSVKNRYTNRTIWIYVAGVGWDCGYPGQRAESVPDITAFAVWHDCIGSLGWYFHY